MGKIKKISFGQFSLSLGVKNLDASLAFYQALGFEKSGGNQEKGWVILQRKEVKVGLYTFFETGPSGMTFYGENVLKIYEELKDKKLNFQQHPGQEGVHHLTVVDPDENWILFDSI